MAEKNKKSKDPETVSKAISDLRKTLDRRLERIEGIMKGQYEALMELRNVLEGMRMSPSAGADREAQPEDMDGPEERLMTQFGNDMNEYMQLYDELDREMQEKGKKGAAEIGPSIMSFEEWITNGKPENLVLED